MNQPTLRALLDAIERTDPSAGSDARAAEGVMPADEVEIDRWRQRIDAIDLLVLALLNQRADAANVIGHIKKRLGMPVYVPGREVDVLRNVREANAGPLPDRAVTHLFERIIDEIRSLERQRYQDDTGESGDADGRT